MKPLTSLTVFLAKVRPYIVAAHDHAEFRHDKTNDLHDYEEMKTTADLLDQLDNLAPKLKKYGGGYVKRGEWRAENGNLVCDVFEKCHMISVEWLGVQVPVERTVWKGDTVTLT